MNLRESTETVPAAPSVQVVCARFVTIQLASVMTGFTPGAIRTKIAKSVWLEGRQWVKRDGRVLIDMKGYEQWAEQEAE
ncbi:excisionase [Variovorax paradoxus]|uniref:Excisionase n=1 Tax=Variovorax paradoxus TaxID=34073 RepID=A0AA91DGN6_VARPD|nr:MULTISPECIES: excisionase [Variovorax]OAK55027.1 excisionase [Variovorax paradoxus]QRY30581.1 excisionase [Variovorax sp. PDNC026]